MSRQLIITVSDRGRHVVVALTDRQTVYHRWRRRSATTACMTVYRLLKRGHRLAFPRALAALEREARAELFPARLAQAAD